MQYVSSSDAGCQPAIVGTGRDGRRVVEDDGRGLERAQYCGATPPDSGDGAMVEVMAPGVFFESNHFEGDEVHEISTFVGGLPQAMVRDKRQFMKTPIAK